MRRIAFYSYDEHGLGHVRRSIAIAHAPAAAEPVSTLLIAGAREAALFRLPEETDTLALPAPGTDFNGVPRIDVDGLSRIPALLDELLATPDDRLAQGAITPARRFTRGSRAIATGARGVSE
jgi:hypothetical protein